jgi:hypothetical protein
LLRTVAKRIDINTQNLPILAMLDQPKGDRRFGVLELRLGAVLTLDALARSGVIGTAGLALRLLPRMSSQLSRHGFLIMGAVITSRLRI